MGNELQAKPRVVAVTGASGYIGMALCHYLVEKHIHVRGLSRRALSMNGVRHVAYELRHEVPDLLLEGVDAVIHAAAETSRGADPDMVAELSGLDNLLNAAGKAGCRFVFISSQAARTDAPTEYGRLKAQAEQRVLAHGGLVARPGQVYGGPEKGLWGSLAAWARSAPMIPRFLPEPFIQPIHVEDLASGLTTLALDHRYDTRIYLIADPEPVAFSRFLREIARQRFGRRLLRLPVPLKPIFLALHLAERIGIRSGFAGRLKSLNDLPILDSAADMHMLGLPIQRFPSGLARPDQNRRTLLREGAIILRYLLRTKPDLRLIRRYGTALRILGETAPLDITALVRRLPLLLTLFDQPGARKRAGEGDALSRRIDLALILTEASAENSDRFLLERQLQRRFMQICSACLGLIMEAVARLTDLLIGRFWLDGIRPRAFRNNADGV